MSMTIKQIIDVLEEFAPPAIIDDWDHVGLMVGGVNKECTGVMVALDMTLDVAKQAKALGCNLIVSHHPFIFYKLGEIDFATEKGECIEYLIKNDIAVFSAHTNLDKTVGGISWTLCEMFGGKNMQCLGDGVVCEVEKTTYGEFAKLVASKIEDNSIRIACANLDTPINKAYVVSGGGMDDERIECAKQVADVFVSGDGKHHNFMKGTYENYPVIDFSHYSSEIIMQDIIKKALKDTGVRVEKAKQARPFWTVEEI